MPDPRYTICIPGQGLQVNALLQSEAVAPHCVLIVSPLGNFEAQGTLSKVELVVLINGSDGNAVTMMPENWTEKVISAWLPGIAPPGHQNGMFSVRVTTQSGTVYRASPVKVTSIGGTGGYPPTHDPLTGEPLQVPVPVNSGG